MSRFAPVPSDNTSNALTFWCPGCDGAHSVQHGAGTGPRWGWNGDVDKPTLTPSILVTMPGNPNAGEQFKEWRTTRVCHSYVTDGRIQFLTDCTHELAGQTVDLPAWDEA